MPKRLAPAERVERLRRRYGSHDRLAAELRERGLTGATRQTIIRWEKGGGIGIRYARMLAELAGVDVEDFRPSAVRAPSPRRQQAEVVAAIERLEERVSRIERLVETQDDGGAPRAGAAGR